MGLRVVVAAPGRWEWCWLAGLSLLFLAGFVACLALSALAYPGGSWADEAAGGFRPLVNYWCDLLRARGLNGEPNALGAGLARGAFCSLAAGLLAYWWAAARLVAIAVWRRLALACGSFAAVGLGAVALVPYETNRIFHVAASIAGGAAGLTAVLALVVGGWSAERARAARRGLGIALLAAVGATLAAYVEALQRGGGSVALAVLQKVATLLVVPWMAANLLASHPCRGGASSATETRG